MKNLCSSLFVLSSLVLANAASAQDYERIAPKLPPTVGPAPGVPKENTPPKLAPDEDAPIIQNVRAIRLLAAPGELQEKGLKQSRGVGAEPAVELLAHEPRFRAELESTFIDHSLSKRKLEMLRL